MPFTILEMDLWTELKVCIVIFPKETYNSVSLDTLQPLPQIDSEQFSDDCFTTYTQ